MMLPTNDGFVGLNGWEISSAPGTYTIDLNAYDAGTEANTELMNAGAGGAPGVSGIPGDRPPHWWPVVVALQNPNRPFG